MATIPVIPTVDTTVGSMGTFSAPNVTPMENAAPKQIAAMGEIRLKAGLQAMKIADQIQSDLDDAKTKELDIAFADRVRENLYNAETGYMNSVGKIAVDRRKTTEEAITKSRQEIEGNLQNDVQRVMFKQIADKRMLAARTEMDQHALRQLKVYNIGESKARIDNLMQDAVTNSAGWSLDESQYRLFKTAMESEIKNMAALSGIAENTDQYKNMIKDTNTKLHSLVLTRMIDSDKLDQARNYLKDYRGEINSDALNKIDKALEVGTFDAKTQELTESIMVEAKNDTATALALARQKLSGREEDAVVQRLKTLETERIALRNQRNQDLGKQAWSFIMQGQNIPTTLQSQLIENNPEELRQIRDWQQAKARQARAEREQDGFGFDAYYGLVQMSLRDPDQFAALDLRKSEPYMSKSQLNALVGLQVNIGRQDNKAMQSQRVLDSTLKMIKSEVAAIGIDLTPKEGTKKAKDTAQFLGALSLALNDATAAKGSPLNNDEAKRIGMSMLREGIEQGSGIFGFFQSKKRGYQISTDQNINPSSTFVVANFNDIPKNIRDELITSYISKTGKNLERSIYGQRYILSEEDRRAIERAYTDGINKGRFK